MLARSANGFGLLALSALLADEARAAAPPSRSFPGLPKPHFPAKAKNVIFCFMDGGVSHVDSFDPKPGLDKRDGQTYKDNRKWLKSPWKFKPHGKCGMPVSELFPHIASCADDLAVIRSMKAELPLHSTGVLLLHTGSNNAGRPSLGSWVTYGLGSENRNLPGFVVLNFNTVPCGGMENFSSGFLPASHQATLLRADGTPLANISPADRDARAQLAKLRLLKQQDLAFSRVLGGEESIESAIKNYEVAYRMQSLVPDVLDLSKETAATKKLYGLDVKDPVQRLYATQCLRARRLVQAGVRFVEVNCPSLADSNGTWDQHGNLKEGHGENARVTDQAIAGLLKDLKARGMLKDTLVVWAGEFGRTPHAPGRDGRDHHPEGFSVWLAGGGIKGGTIHGATDELGMRASEKICDIHDLHATILHLLGVSHEKLTFRHGGRDFRLTDVHGHVVKEILV
jgi:hypothetical protein